MPSHATVCVSNYFSSSKASVAWRSSYYESARGIDKKLCLAVHPAVADWFYDLVDDFFAQLVHTNVRRMLCRNDHRVYALWHPLFIDNRYLGLAVWPDPAKLFFLSYLCEPH